MCHARSDAFLAQKQNPKSLIKKKANKRTHYFMVGDVVGVSFSRCSPSVVVRKKLKGCFGDLAVVVDRSRDAHSFDRAPIHLLK